MQEERRQQERASSTVLVEDLSEKRTMHAINIGRGGMMVSTTHARWPGSLLRVRFVLPGEERGIRVTCRVANIVEGSQGVCLALQFLRVSPEALVMLDRYVALHPTGSVTRDGSSSRIAAL